VTDGFRTPSGQWVVRQSNGEVTSIEAAVGEPVPRADDSGIRIPAKYLWPVLGLILGGGGGSVASILGALPGAQPQEPDARVAVLMQRADAIETELARVRSTAERTERNLIRIAERLHVREVEKP
jgi:hypothetical protein